MYVKARQYVSNCIATSITFGDFDVALWHVSLCAGAADWNYTV